MSATKAVKIDLFNLKTVPMQTFHLTWMAFFVTFFSWFAISPLMPLIRQDLGLTKVQIGNTIIASVAITIVARLIIGWLCDRIGPRRSYTALLVVSAFPIMGIGLAHDYNTFLLFRLAIGIIGASFVITQYHASRMFAPNCVGTASAAAAGWGNMGGGIAQMVMPLILTMILSFGVSQAWGWRLSMLVPGVALLIMAFVYYRYTQDFPEGDIMDLRRRNLLPPTSQAKGSFRATLKDPRVIALALMYAASFGVELTMNNIAALYFTDNFHLSLTAAGLVAGTYGMMDIFARACGGICSDRIAGTRGLKGRVIFLGSILLAAGLALITFSRMIFLPAAIAVMVCAALCVKMSNGAVYALVPFMNRKATGAVAGIVGAGGNLGGVLFGLLFRQQSISYSTGLLYIGCFVTVASCFVLLVRFSTHMEEETKEAFQAAHEKKLQKV